MQLRIVLTKDQALALAEQIVLTHRVLMPDGWMADALARDTFAFNHMVLTNPPFAVEPADWRESWRLASSSVVAAARRSIMEFMRLVFPSNRNN